MLAARGTSQNGMFEAHEAASLQHDRDRILGSDSEKKFLDSVILHSIEAPATADTQVPFELVLPSEAHATDLST